MALSKIIAVLCDIAVEWPVPLSGGEDEDFGEGLIRRLMKISTDQKMWDLFLVLPGLFWTQVKAGPDPPMDLFLLDKF